MMGKTSVTETEPGLLVLSKRGRAVSVGAALGILKAQFPHIAPERWQIQVGEHKTAARLRDQT